ncbi:P-loop containing nucleoside triphosphate hydrolase protein [Radiomyces spectabilis]|uniref:P-loop containing nucleoside triphosphate hydrolase protein n=1 Tax=Radiomyces spectabilis TaxID=64574 RepID=UPI00221FAEA8|nr:P-loop containing nucleoside triphosphate hydrolase protein [Radiomyces spectabilis]KAI8374154.1 P-loop containing nucleoside triphosphate hydrolase protein [Radiomyces spectabilis]
MPRPPRKKRHIQNTPAPDSADQATASTEQSIDTQNERNGSPSIREESVGTQINHDEQTSTPSIQPSPDNAANATEKTIDEEKKSRLVITKMVLKNFKSYAGRQVIGPFHKSFSAIVGPNGSGKSNVIDALLFVFGYRANKMRQGKLSELIHNSAKYPNLDSCAVEIHFQEIIDRDDSSKFDVVPNSRLAISRQAYRNNASKYFINDKTSSYTEVTALLRARGIDLDHKRFLILQGEVESIALMKAKAKDDNDDGLLEYLEDIIGTSKYKEPIEKTSAQLETLNEERLEKFNRVKYVAKEKDNLEEKKAEAESYLDNENELAKRKNELYQIYLYEANTNIDIANEALEELQEKLQEEEQKQSEAENEIKELEETYQTTVREYNGLEAQMSEIQKQHAKYEREDVQLRERKDYLSNKQEKAKATMEADREARTAAREAIKTNADALQLRQADLTKLEKQLKSEEKTLDEINRELKGKTDGYLAEIEEHQKKLAPWTEKINKKKKDIDVRRSEAEILAERISSGVKALENAEKALQNVKKAREQKLKESNDLPVEIENLEKEIAELEDQVKVFVACIK